MDWSGAGIWLSTLASSLIAGAAGVWFGRRLQREDARRDRLRALYGQLMEAALRWTPREFGKRVPDSAQVEPVAGEVDALVARLMVEAHADEDDVIKAFLGVHRAIAVYSMDKTNAGAGLDTPRAQLERNRQDVYDALHKMQNAMRERLK